MWFEPSHGPSDQAGSDLPVDRSLTRPAPNRPALARPMGPTP
jgi:hypothetical protein